MPASTSPSACCSLCERSRHVGIDILCEARQLTKELDYVYVYSLPPEHASFVRATRNMLVREAQASVRISVVARAASRRDCDRALLTDRSGPDGALKQ